MSLGSEEFSERPVPVEARLGFGKPAAVWAGFAYAYICIFIGSQIMGGLGAPIGYLAIIAGQAFLFVYSGLIAHKAFKFGFNFPLMVKSVFGRLGYAPMALLIAGLVNGWFVFQAWLAADLMIGLWGGKSFLAGTGSGVLPGILGETAFWAGAFALVFGMVGVYGIRIMAWFGRIAIVLVTILAGYMVYAIVTEVGKGADPFHSAVVGTPWTFALGVTASIGTFIVSATMTGDFCRWTKSAKQAWLVTLVAFPTCNQIMLFTGAIFTAVALKLDFYFGLSAVGGGALIMAVQWISNGTTCDGCLYNCTHSYRNVVYHLSRGRKNISWKKMASIAMIVGAAVGVSNLMNSIVPWLLLLGTIVPLVGGPLIGHFWIVARKNTVEEILNASTKRVSGPAVVGFLVGLAIAVPITLYAPDLPALIGGLVGGLIVYPAVAYATGYTKGGRLTAKAMGESMPGAERSSSGSSGGPSGTNASEGTPRWVRKIESFIDEVFPWMSLRDTRFRSSLGGGLK